MRYSCSSVIFSLLINSTRWPCLFMQLYCASGQAIFADEVVVVPHEDKVLGNVFLPPDTLIIFTRLSIRTMTVIHALHTFVVGVAFGKVRVTSAEEIIPLPVPA